VFITPKQMFKMSPISSRKGVQRRYRSAMSSTGLR